MKIESNTIQSRLRQWGEFVRQPRHDIDRMSSPSGKLVDERNAAGSRGSGIKYDLLIIDGETVVCPPDGGMMAAVEMRGRVIAHNIRCKETGEAVSWLPAQRRKIVIQTYVVPHGADVRTASLVASQLGLDESTVRKSLAAAYKQISLHIYGPPMVAIDAETDEEKAA